MQNIRYLAENVHIFITLFINEKIEEIVRKKRMQDFQKEENGRGKN